MRWIGLLLFVCGSWSLQAQFSVQGGVLWSFPGDYVEQHESLSNSIVRVVDPETNDTTYRLNLLTLINESDHIFKAKPGWQFGVDYNHWLGQKKKFGVNIGAGVRGRSWEYNADPKRFIFYEQFIDTIPKDQVPQYEESLVCDTVINNPGSTNIDEFARLSILDLMIPFGFKIKFSERFDAGFNVLFSLPIRSQIRTDYRRTEFYVQDDLQFCETFLDERVDESGDFFRDMRWSSELRFTYWIQNFGIQAVAQTSTGRLMADLPDTGPSPQHVVETDTFKPRFLGLVLKYKFDKNTGTGD